jgi:DNA processing protein
LTDAPQTLQAVGDISLLQTRLFTVVGSRRTPVSALKAGTEIVKGLSSAVTIVTGTADGGDTAAIEGALSVGGKVICVLAGGFSAIPQNNFALLKKVAENGLVLSPHAYDEQIRSFSYEYRNKLLATLGEGTLVLGAAEKSGALITAKYALAQGKKVFALPYSLGVTAGAGCNALIKKGAYLTETADDVLEQFHLQTARKETPKITLTEDEEKLIKALRDTSGGHVTALAQTAGVPLFKARALLSALEVKGLCVSIGGNQYAPV